MDQWPTRAITWTGGAFLHFALYESKGARASGAQISIQVPDLSSADRASVSAGATVVHEPRAEPWGTSALYLDYDGNIVELTQRS